MSDKPILLLDFDGVIHDGSFTGETPMGDPVKGALKFMMEATQYFEVNVLSARSATLQGRVAMEEYLIRQAMKDSNPLVNRRTWINEVRFPEHKPPAFVGYDDRTKLFEGKFDDPKELLKFESWREGGQ